MAFDDKLREEMRLLAEVNDQLLGKGHSDGEIHLEPTALALAEPEDEVAQLRSENAQLREHIEEIETRLLKTMANEEAWQQRQQEYEAILEEKSEVIRELHLKLQQVLQHPPAPAAPAAPDLSAAENDAGIKQLRRDLEEQRRQLEQDEESLMQQMRQMEMAMSRDRAELARQRGEVQRLQADLNREIELASRDAGLRDRLQSLQRRQQDVVARKGGAAPSSAQPASTTEAAATPSIKKSGFFGRLFGK